MLVTRVYVFVWKLTPLASGLSDTKPFAGWVLSPSRSRTMSLYSTREMRRRGEGPTRDPPLQSEVSLMSCVPTGTAAGRDAEASLVSPRISAR